MHPFRGCLQQPTTIITTITTTTTTATTTTKNTIARNRREEKKRKRELAIQSAVRMQSRIPLSIVFSAEGKRHAIPHCTFRVPVLRDADASATDEEKEGISFFYYLDSNDTRLPSHPHLRAYAQPAEEYETYVGEEVWDDQVRGDKSVHTATTAAVAEGSFNEVVQSETSAPPVMSSSAQDTVKSDTDAATLAPLPAFHSVVSWIDRVFDAEAWAADGVVLCGRYVVADDGAWVVPSRSPTLYSTREVLLLMRNSCKFLCDVHAQMKTMKNSAAVATPSGLLHHRRSASAPTMYLEFSLAKSLAGSGASEMRAILPYSLHFSASTQTWVTGYTIASLSFTGIGQRMTDACFPSLMAWTEEEHDANFRLMLRRVEQAALLERTREVDPDFITRLVKRFYKRRDAAALSQPGSSCMDDDAHRAEERLALLLSVDLLFEGPSLPIYILSAKARVFAVAPRGAAVWDDLLSTTPSWSLWTPLLKDEETADGEDSVTPAALAVEASVPHALIGLPGQHPMEDVEKENTSEDDDDEEGAAATLNFFRMFRDIEHWNHYVAAMVQRLHDAAADSSSSPEANKPSRNVQHYCVVASESGDLITCGDTLTKRGLPLELMHPELLEANEEAAVFLKMLRDGLFKNRD
jgi:hypothetical protein